MVFWLSIRTDLAEFSGFLRDTHGGGCEMRSSRPDAYPPVFLARLNPNSGLCDELRCLIRPFFGCCMAEYGLLGKSSTLLWLMVGFAASVQRRWSGQTTHGPLAPRQAPRARSPIHHQRRVSRSRKLIVPSSNLHIHQRRRHARHQNRGKGRILDRCVKGSPGLVFECISELRIAMVLLSSSPSELAPLTCCLKGGKVPSGLPGRCGGQHRDDRAAENYS